MTVGVAVQQSGATINSDFIASSPRFSFGDKDNTSQNYIVSIKGDDIPEPDEDIVIKLVNPTGGARVATGTISFSAIQLSQMQYNAMQYNQLQHDDVQCNAIQCSNVMYSTLPTFRLKEKNLPQNK